MGENKTHFWAGFVCLGEEDPPRAVARMDITVTLILSRLDLLFWLLTSMLIWKKNAYYKHSIVQVQIISKCFTVLWFAFWWWFWYMCKCTWRTLLFLCLGVGHCSPLIVAGSAFSSDHHQCLRQWEWQSSNTWRATEAQYFHVWGFIVPANIEKQIYILGMSLQQSWG